MGGHTARTAELGANRTHFNQRLTLAQRGEHAIRTFRDGLQRSGAADFLNALAEAVKIPPLVANFVALCR